MIDNFKRENENGLTPREVLEFEQERRLKDVTVVNLFSDSKAKIKALSASKGKRIPETIKDMVDEYYSNYYKKSENI